MLFVTYQPVNELSPYPTLNRGSSYFGTFPSHLYTGKFLSWS